MQSTIAEPIKIGFIDMVTINELTAITLDLEQIEATIEYTSGPVGVLGRCSHNKQMNDKLNWTPKTSLELGMNNLLLWVKSIQINN